MTASIQGQALTETVGALLLLTVCAGSGAAFLRLQWLEVKCIHQAFSETVRRAMLTEAEERDSTAATPDGTTIRWRCGRRMESVHLRSLDSMESWMFEQGDRHATTRLQ